MTPASTIGAPILYPAMIDDDPAPASSADPGAFADALGNALRSAGSAFDRAAGAEAAFAAGGGDLQSMVIARAQADVALGIATAAASRTSQALSTVLAMQI